MFPVTVGLSKTHILLIWIKPGLIKLTWLSSVVSTDDDDEEEEEESNETERPDCKYHWLNEAVSTLPHLCSFEDLKLRLV